MGEIQRNSWQSWLRDNPDYAAPGQQFSLSPRVELVYGKLTSECVQSERGLIQYLLRFANGQEDRGGARQFLELPAELDWPSNSAEDMLRSVGADPTEPRLAKTLKLTREAVDDWKQMRPVAERDWATLRADLSEPRLTERRQRLKDFLSRVVLDRKGTADQFQIEEERLAGLLQIRPVLKRGKGSVVIEPYYIMGDADAFETYTCTLFLGIRDGQDFGGDLCQCNLADCKRFFLKERVSRKGPPQRKYCPNTDHADQAHKLTDARRQSDKNKRKRAQRLLIDRGYGPRAAEQLIKQAFESHRDATPEHLSDFARNAAKASRKHK